MEYFTTRGDGVKTQFILPATSASSLTATVNGVNTAVSLFSTNIAVITPAPASDSTVTIAYLDGDSSSEGGTTGSTTGLIVGQVIDYIGTTTPANFADVDYHPIQNNSVARWLLRSNPSGMGWAPIISTTFCSVGNKLFCLMWNLQATSDGSNCRAAVTLDENDIDTLTLRSRILYGNGSAISAATAAAIDNDRVLVSLSSTVYGQTFTYIYTLSSDTWTWVANFNTAAGYSVLSSVKLDNGKILTFAYGGVAKVYDPVANTWADTGASPKPAGYLTKIADGRVVLAGAKYDLSSSTAAIYNPTTNTWSAVANTPTGLKQTFGIPLSDGRVAYSGNTVSHVFYVYNPTANTWTTVSFNFNKGSATSSLSCGAVLANGRVLVPWGQYNGTQGSLGTNDLCWTGWNIMELLSPDVTRFSSEIRKIQKVA